MQCKSIYFCLPSCMLQAMLTMIKTQRRKTKRIERQCLSFLFCLHSLKIRSVFHAGMFQIKWHANCWLNACKSFGYLTLKSIFNRFICILISLFSLSFSFLCHFFSVVARLSYSINCFFLSYRLKGIELEIRLCWHKQNDCLLFFAY